MPNKLLTIDEAEHKFSWTNGHLPLVDFANLRFALGINESVWPYPTHG